MLSETLRRHLSIFSYSTKQNGSKQGTSSMKSPYSCGHVVIQISVSFQAVNKTWTIPCWFVEKSFYFSIAQKSFCFSAYQKQNTEGGMNKLLHFQWKVVTFIASGSRWAAQSTSPAISPTSPSATRPLAPPRSPGLDAARSYKSSVRWLRSSTSSAPASSADRAAGYYWRFLEDRKQLVSPRMEVGAENF